MCVAVGGDDLENAVVQFENRDVEGAPAQVVNDDDAVLILVETVRERGGGRFIDQTQNMRPAMRLASLVACRCASLKYAGTVMTALVTGAPKKRSALRFSWRRISAEISAGCRCGRRF